MEEKNYEFHAELSYLRPITRVTAPDEEAAKYLIKQKIQAAHITPEQRKFLLDNMIVVKGLAL